MGSRLSSVSSELSSLNCEAALLTRDVEDKANYLRTCSPPGTWSPSATCNCRHGDNNPVCNYVAGYVEH